MEQYRRHINLFSEEQFGRIQRARVLVAGAGGLGSTVLQLLVRYGFGVVHFYDDGILDPPDLNRQLLYTTCDLDRPKVNTALTLLQKINPDVTLIAHREKLSATSELPDIDLVIDCLDSFVGRGLLDERFFNNQIPIIHGGATAFCGQVTTLIPGQTPSLTEIYGRTNMEDDSEAPKDIYPPVVTTIASLQVSEAIKLVSGYSKQLLLNKLQVVDLMNNSFDVIGIATG